MLLLASQNLSNWSTLDLLGRLLSVIVAIAFVMFLAYYTTRWLAGARYARRGNSNIKLLEGAAVGPHSSVQLIRAGMKVFLIGVTRERITFLAEIPIDEIKEPEFEFSSIPFEKYLKACRDKLSGSPNKRDEKE